MTAASLLLLKRLLALLQHIGYNVSTSRMSSRNLAICLGPNLRSPSEEELLLLDTVLEVAEKVRLFEQTPKPSWPMRAWLSRGPCLPPLLSKCW